jgi:hypothetical protein
MPNIWSCDPDWFEQMVQKEEKVAVVVWSGAKDNEYLNKMGELEKQGIPVFVCDSRTCGPIAERLGLKEGGETIVFERGVEKGRVIPSEDAEGNFKRVQELTSSNEG